MMKFIVLVSAVICFAHANPVADNYPSSGTQGTYSNYGNWPRPQFSQFSQFPQMQWPRIQPPRMITPQEIENMKGVPGSEVNGMSQTVNTHTVYENGKPVTKVEGQTIWNKNGNVEKKTFGN